MDPASEAFVAEEGKDMPEFGMDMDQGLDFGAGLGDFRERINVAKLPKSYICV